MAGTEATTPSSHADPGRPPPAEEDARPRPVMLFRYGVYVSLGVLAVLAAAAAVYTARVVLIQALIALFVAVSLEPAVRLLQRWGLRRGLAVLAIFLAALGLVAVFLWTVIPAMAHQFETLVRDLPGYLAALQDRSARFRELSDRYNLTGQVQSLLASLPGKLGSGLLGLAGRLFGALFSTVTVVILTICFMASLPRLRHGALRLMPLAGFFVVYQHVENHLIAPRVHRATVSLSMSAVLLAGLTGGTAFGLVGAIVPRAEQIAGSIIP